MNDTLFATTVVTDNMLTLVDFPEEFMRSVRMRLVQDLFNQLPLETDEVVIRFYPSESDRFTFTTRYFASADRDKVKELEEEIEWLRKLV